MPKIEYVTKRLSEDRLALIGIINQIIDNFQKQGFDLTVRQVFYQFVKGNLFPPSWVDVDYNIRHGLDPSTQNTEKNYKKLGKLISDGRLAGLIDWGAVVDRTRALRRNSHWDGAVDIIDTCVTNYRRDLWSNQPTAVNVLIEKDALVGVIEGVCRQEDVPYMSCRGFSSDSAMWRAAQNILKRNEDYGQDTVILHLGDHDPSGVDMTRDIREKLALFGADEDILEVRRIALNLDQVQELDLPPNPAKQSDSRYLKYAAEYGDDCWELDALEPGYMVDLIRSNIEEIRDGDIYSDDYSQQVDDQVELSKIRDNWGEVSDLLTTFPDPRDSVDEDDS